MLDLLFWLVVGCYILTARSELKARTRHSNKSLEWETLDDDEPFYT
jgi:hypothetical protein